MKKLIFCIAFILTVITLTSCTSTKKATTKEKEYTEDIKQRSLDKVGLPDVDNFFEMGQLKEIYEKRDNPKLVCYWYKEIKCSKKLMYMGKCIGYGIPYSTQITAPSQVMNEKVNDAGQMYIIEQSEPNGMYSTGATTATWVLAINGEDESNITPLYCEFEVLVSPFKLDRKLVEEFSIPDDY